MSCSRARLTKLREVMAENGWEGFFVRDTSNIRWLTAFDGVFDDEAAHALIVDQMRAVLHTDSRYLTACQKAAEEEGVVAVNGAVAKHGEVAFTMLLEDYPDIEYRDPNACACGDDATALTLFMALEDSISLGEFRRLQGQRGSKPISFVETSDVILDLRAVKDHSEIARMEEAQSITDAAFSYIIGYMKPGMTEREVQLELEDYMLRHGAEGLAFPSIVATGANGASPHAIPGETKLEAGQCVVLDFGARARGYCSDMTRTVFLGEPDEKMRSAWETLRRANETVEALLKPSVTGREAHQAAEDILAEGGFAGRMGHGLGHGVGIDVHEKPVLSLRNPKPLVAGNVVTVEPGIYLPGEFGMRLEDFGVVTDDGYRVFTQSTHEMVII